MMALVGHVERREIHTKFSRDARKEENLGIRRRLNDVIEIN